MIWAGPDVMGLGIEVGEIAGTDVHCADAEAHQARIDAVEIHQPLERFPQR